MRVVALAAQKGGAGKSTLAVHLATIADAEEGPALIVDCDSQGSAHFWFQLRKSETPLLVACSYNDLAATLAAAKRHGVKWAFIDLPPHDAGHGLSGAIRLADIVLCPMRPATFDLAAIQATLNLAKSLKRAYGVVINAAPPKRGIADAAIVREAREALRALQAPFLETAITQRAALSHALAGGLAVTEFEPTGRAAKELRDLWTEVKDWRITP
jgi:chromosome partitioning protein